MKISCRNIWKVYGPESDSYFDNRNGAVEDPAALYERMREDSHVVAASDVTFDVQVGEIFIIMGLSGSGKSTMVRCLSRLVEPTAGEVLLDRTHLFEIEGETPRFGEREETGVVRIPIERPPTHASIAGRPRRPRERLSPAALRRPAAARRHRPLPRG